MIFRSWAGLLRTLIAGVAAYAALLVLLRSSGKRTLSKMNAFDFIVTVALGSTLATIILSGDTLLIEGITALALLIFLQYAITWLAVRSAKVRRLIKAEPSLLYHGDEFLEGTLKKVRVNRAEILQGMRNQGYSELEQVEAVILETDGSLSVIPKSGERKADTLANVNGLQKALRNWAAPTKGTVRWT